MKIKEHWKRWTIGIISIGAILTFDFIWYATHAPLPAPQLMSPANGSILSGSGALHFTWSAVPQAQSYRIDIQICGKSVCMENDWLSILPKIAQNAQETQFAFCETSSFATEQYRWQVWAVDKSGNEGYKSSWWLIAYQYDNHLKPCSFSSPFA